MVSMKDVKVSAIIEEDSTNEQGMPQRMTRIFYMIADNGPYSVLIPTLDLNAPRVMHDVQNAAMKLIDVLNIQFQ